MGFKKGLVLLLVFLCVPFIYASFTVNLVTQDGLVVNGDQAIVYFSINSSSTDILTTDNTCTANGLPSTFNTTTYAYNATITLSGQTITLNCLDYTYLYNVTYTSPYRILYDFLSMQSLENTFYLYAYNYSSTNLATPRVITNSTTCEVTLEGTPRTLSTSVGYGVFNHTFSGFGNVSFLATCEFGDGILPLSVLENISVSAYEPKLEPVYTHPFSALTSSSGFRLGNYDLDLDGYDDVLILSSSGLRVYYGPLYDTNHLVTSQMVMSSDSHFFITDFDWDGYGDILLYNSTSVRLFRYQDRLTYSNELLFSGSNVEYAGTFDIDGNFLKDIIILNGTALTWNYTIIQDVDATKVFTGTLNIGIDNRCSAMLIFDINEDIKEDIVCLDTETNRIRYLIRDSLSLPTQTFSEYSLGYSASDIFFGDITSDGNWELGVYDSQNKMFKNYNTSFSLIKQIELFNPSTLYGHLFLDILNSNENQFSTYYTNATRQLQINYDDTKLYSFTQFQLATSGITHLDLNNDGFSDLLLSNLSPSPTRKPFLFNNTLSLYKNAPDDSFSAQVIPHESALVNFTLDIDADWNYNNYQLVIRHSRDGTVYRNDYFDSKQNLKYYRTTQNHEYAFNLSSFDLYSVDVRLNKYNMLLTSQTASYVQTPGSLNCLFTELDCNLINSSFSNNNITPFLPTYLRFADATFTIANKVFLDKIFENRNTTLSLTNATFSNTTLEFRDSPNNLTLSNVSLSLSQIAIVDANATFQNITQSLTNITLTNSTVVVRNSNLVLNGTNFTVHAYNATIFYETTDEAIIVNYYNTTRIRFIDMLGNAITRTYNVSSDLFNLSSTASEIFTDFLVGRNQILNPISISFTEDFLYFPNNQSNYIFTNETQNLTFIPTGLPVWDYAVNGTNQTDFRNFTLLTTITNLNNTNFSIGSGFNLTFIAPANYSSQNFSELIVRNNATTITIGFDVPFRASLNTSLTGRVAVLPTYAIAEQTQYGREFFAPGAGTYTLVSDAILSVSIPSVVGRNVQTPIAISYRNYNGSIDATDSCTLAITPPDVAPLAANLDLLTLSIAGTHSYTVTCTAGELPFASFEGTFDVKNQYLPNYLGKTRFAQFTLHYTDADLTDAFNRCVNYTLEGFGVAHYVSANTCGWNVSFTSTTPEIIVKVTNETVTEEEVFRQTITLLDGRILYDSTSVIGDFIIPSFMETAQLHVVSKSSLIAPSPGLNFSINYFNKESVQNITKTTSNLVLHTYRGDLNNNKKNTLVLS
jgi:hypothetical protein